MDALRDVADYVWSLVLLLLGLLAAGWKKMHWRIETLERNTRDGGQIDEQIAASEKRLEQRIETATATMTRQHSELRSDIHRMNADNAESRSQLYSKVDQVRLELKQDLKDFLDLSRRG